MTKNSRRKILITATLLLIYLTAMGQEMQINKISDDVAVLTGRGGNVTGVKTSEGLVIFDSFTTPEMGTEARNLLEKHFGGLEVKYLINTHHHSDHTGGNAAFADVTIIAHKNNPPRSGKAFAERYQKEIEAGKYQAPRVDKLISETTTMEIGGKTFVLYYLGNAHTDNDLAVLIKEEKLLILEDLLFYNRLPYILHDHGCDVENWITTLQFFIDHKEMYSKVIPGHGAAVTDREGIIDAQRYLKYLWGSVKKAKEEGKTLEQAKKEITLDIFENLGSYKEMLGNNIENCWRILERE